MKDDEAVVEKNFISRLHVLAEIGIGYGNAGVVAHDVLGREAEHVALF